MIRSLQQPYLIALIPLCNDLDLQAKHQDHFISKSLKKSCILKMNNKKLSFLHEIHNPNMINGLKQ